MVTGAAKQVNLAVAEVNSRTLEQLSPEELSLYRRKVPFTRTLDLRWIGQSGNMGDPTRASAAHGEKIIARTVEVGMELLTVLSQQHEHRKTQERSSPK